MYLIWTLNPATLPTFLVGGFVMLVGIAMGLKQWHAQRELQNDSQLDEREYRDAERTIRLRHWLSGLFVLTGFLITLGGRFEALFQLSASNYFAFSVTYLGGLLLLLFAIVILGSVDLSWTMAAWRRAGNHGLGGRQQLEEELRRYRVQRQQERHTPQETAALDRDLSSNPPPGDASGSSPGDPLDPSSSRQS